MSQPDLAVIIPTHNRRAMLLQTLSALAAQTYPADCFEVVVVCDGCSDDTYVALQALTLPFHLIAISQSSAGAAGARNRGVQATTARVVLFLDDDIIATPYLLAEHMRFHDEARRVVIGRLLPDRGVRRAGWTRWEQRTWDRRYADFQRGAAVGGQHFFSGNVSVDREAFVAVGGFNTTLKRAEDTELGFRLQRAGASFCFSAGAAGIHCGVHSFRAWRTIQYNYGRYDIQLAYREGHSDLMPLAAWFRDRNVLNRALIRTTVDQGSRQRIILPLARIGAWLSDQIGINPVSHWSYSVIANVAYWQGISDELGGAHKLWHLIDGSGTFHGSTVHA